MREIHLIYQGSGYVGWFEFVKIIESSLTSRRGFVIEDEDAWQGGRHEHNICSLTIIHRTALSFAVFSAGEGTRFTSSARGSEVLARVKEIRPHVVVLDVNLPDIDGHEICRELRKDPFGSGIPGFDAHRPRPA